MKINSKKEEFYIGDNGEMYKKKSYKILEYF